MTLDDVAAAAADLRAAGHVPRGRKLEALCKGKRHPGRKTPGRRLLKPLPPAPPAQAHAAPVVQDPAPAPVSQSPKVTLIDPAPVDETDDRLPWQRPYTGPPRVAGGERVPHQQELPAEVDADPALAAQAALRHAEQTFLDARDVLLHTKLTLFATRDL